MREVLKMVELRATAFGRSSRPTSSDDERLARRVVERVADAEDRGEDVDLPELDVAGGGEDRQRERLQRHHRLRDEQEAPLPHAVGDHAAEEREAEDRRELHRGDGAERERRVRQSGGPATRARSAASRCRRARRPARTSRAGSSDFAASGTCGAPPSAQHQASSPVPAAVPLSDLCTLRLANCTAMPYCLATP